VVRAVLGHTMHAPREGCATGGKAVAFRLIQIAWLPIALVGYVPFVIKLILVSRASGVSATALASLYTRWMQHALGTSAMSRPSA
jgi:hypothetical protein